MVLRFIRFNVVGALGVGVQLLVVAALVGWCGLHYLIATAVGIEAAILNNFFWHVHWTWAVRNDSAPGGPAAPLDHLFFRCVAFHAGNGLVTMVGSMMLMPVLVGGLHLHYILANVAAICCTGLMNFVIGDRLVFRRAP